ncbi:MAG: sigma-70 family RNA polymerase sigma factor [Anaerolineae bacterium]|nr:sigma-70 family RNA polymerase sigma factor [Anaerolineae bacterium]NUQ06493.1 sigma-70 family RNA polymerase sigma factor [Anaerolineae bacterium]
MTNLSLLDHQNFEARVAPQRSELLAHCYRMMGSLSDAEDLVQETLLRAWRRRDTYVEDASLRAWLYRIATNACLDALRKRRRRVIPLNYEEESSAADPIPPAVSDPIWLEPFPDALLAPLDQHPEGRLLIRETLSIAFMAALQLLTPRQRAVLLLSDVLDWSDAEIADLLGTSVSAVKSALHRARAGTAEAKRGQFQEASLIQDEALRVQVSAYVRAWETADVEGLIALLRDDATFSMPPIPSWYRGREEIRRLVSRTVFAGEASGRWRLLPTRANGQITFGLYRQAESGGWRAYGIQVLTPFEYQIADIITFRDPALAARFGLPDTV